MKLIWRKRLLRGAINDLASRIVIPQMFDSTKKLVEWNASDFGQADRLFNVSKLRLALPSDGIGIVG